MYRVAAIGADGVVGEWAEVRFPADTSHMEPPALGNAMGLMAGPTDDNDPGLIKLTWTAGENANVHFVFGIQTPSYNVGSLVWERADASDSHTLDMMGKPSGSYMFFVIAGQTDDAGDTEWSAWTPGTVTY